MTEEVVETITTGETVVESKEDGIKVATLIIIKVVIITVIKEEAEEAEDADISEFNI